MGMGKWQRHGFLILLGILGSGFFTACNSIGKQPVTWSRQDDGTWQSEGDPGRIALRVQFSRSHLQTATHSNSSELSGFLGQGFARSALVVQGSDHPLSRMIAFQLAAGLRRDSELRRVQFSPTRSRDFHSPRIPDLLITVELIDSSWFWLPFYFQRSGHLRIHGRSTNHEIFENPSRSGLMAPGIRLSWHSEISFDASFLGLDTAEDISVARELGAHVVDETLKRLEKIRQERGVPKPVHPSLVPDNESHPVPTFLEEWIPEDDIQWTLVGVAPLCKTYRYGTFKRRLPSSDLYFDMIEKLQEDGWSLIYGPSDRNEILRKIHRLILERETEQLILNREKKASLGTFGLEPPPRDPATGEWPLTTYHVTYLRRMSFDELRPAARQMIQDESFPRDQAIQYTTLLGRLGDPDLLQEHVRALEAETPPRPRTRIHLARIHADKWKDPARAQEFVQEARELEQSHSLLPDEREELERLERELGLEGSRSP